ncbi:MAG: YbaK/EbsC family protein [Nocardioidaceae bacterium]
MRRHASRRGVRRHGLAVVIVGPVTYTYGKLETERAATRTDLLAEPVVAALAALPDEVAARIEVAEIDPELADTVAMSEAYGLSLEMGANCVIVAGRRAGEGRYAACVVLATTRADVNNVVRRRLDVRKASFAPMEYATETSGMEYGGITPLGLPQEWPLLVDSAVARTDVVCVGSGVRRSKLFLPGGLLERLPGAEVVDGLAR